MNLQALAAMDDCEHATGRSLDEHVRRARTPKEVIADELIGYDLGHIETAGDIVGALRAAGYDIIQRVSQGNKHWPNT